MTLRNGSTLQVDGAHIVEDSTLVGRGFYGDPLSIPTRDVVAVQARHTDVGKTAALVAVCAGVGIPVAYALLMLVAYTCTGPCT